MESATELGGLLPFGSLLRVISVFIFGQNLVTGAFILPKLCDLIEHRHFVIVWAIFAKNWATFRSTSGRTAMGQDGGRLAEENNYFRNHEPPWTTLVSGGR